MRPRPQAPLPLLWRTLAHYFQLDEAQARTWWHALRHSTRHEAAGWRQALLLYEDTATPGRSPDDVVHFVQATCSPQTVMDVLETLVQEGQMHRPVARVLEEHVLTRVDREGHWR